MVALYNSCDAFVLPSRGEGWGRPYMEAMACGLPTIGTRWSGQLEFMHDENSYLIDIDGLEDVPSTVELPFYQGHRWARPKGIKARQEISEKWSLGRAVEKAEQRLELYC